MKKIVLLLSFGILGICSCFGQTIQESDQIFVRVYEFHGGANQSEIIISYGNGKTERINIENFRFKKRETSADQLNMVLSNLRKAGYTISTSNAGGGGEGIFISTYLFNKKE